MAWPPARWRLALTLVAAVQLLSSAIFLFTVRQPVFDEPNYGVDVGRYERQGISLASIRAQESPAGPGMTILASLGGRLFPASVAARRVPMFATWIIAVALLLALARQRSSDEVVPAAGLLLLVFPHTPMSMATLLTEGPAMACVLASLWTSGLANPARNEATAAHRALFAGFWLGLALCFRQYYLALLPALALGWWTDPERGKKWALLLVGPVAALAGYFLVWGGLTSAGARAGTRFVYQAYLGIDLLRPFSALAFVGLYALPLLVSARLRLCARRTGLLVALAALAAAVIVGSGRSVWGNGPMMTILAGVARTSPRIGLAADWLATSVAFAAVLVLAWLVWRAGPRSLEPFAIVCLAFVVFFSLEQAGVGGTIPYYERYAHQTTFFASALVAMLAAPRPQLLLPLVGVLLLESQWLLWRGFLAG